MFVGWLRILVRSEYAGFKFLKQDWFFVMYMLVRVVVYSTQPGTSLVLVGTAFDELGVYFFFRLIIRELQVIQRVPSLLFALGVITLVFFIIEKKTGFNPFSLLGGVPTHTMMREGLLRVQGAFSHPILAGTFWALLSPFMIRYRFTKNEYTKKYGTWGTMLFIGLIFLTASSTPYMVFASGAAGIFFYQYRYHGKKIRNLIVLVYVGLAIVMSGPPYSLIAKVDITGGSTGWHRFAIIDNAIKHFSEWALRGMGSVSTETWGWGLWDITNQFVLVGVQGGAISLFFYCLAVLEGFKNLHLAIKKSENNTEAQKDIWTIWTNLFMHCIAMMVISYFGQLQLIFLFTLALCAAAKNVNGNQYTFGYKDKITEQNNSIK